MVTSGYTIAVVTQMVLKAMIVQLSVVVFVHRYRASNINLVLIVVAVLIDGCGRYTKTYKAVMPVVSGLQLRLLGKE